MAQSTVDKINKGIDSVNNAIPVLSGDKSVKAEVNHVVDTNSILLLFFSGLILIAFGFYLKKRFANG